jgi:hypothetical protein
MAWTIEKVRALSQPEVRQLLANAERLEQPDVAAMCAEVISNRPGREAPQATTSRRPRNDRRRLVPRSLAFGMRGATLANQYWSRGGLTRTGDVVFALWADDVRNDRAGSSCLLWAPNTAGGRPWSDSPGGRERLEHCKRALERGAAHGLLVYGTRLPGVLPEDRAATIEGADADGILALKVEKRGMEFWACWGGPRHKHPVTPFPGAHATGS